MYLLYEKGLHVRRTKEKILGVYFPFEVEFVAEYVVLFTTCGFRIFKY